MKALINKLKLLLIFTMIISTGTLMAQHNHGGDDHGGRTHEHKNPPHGGQLKEVGKYYIEMVTNLMFEKDKISFYLLQKNLNTIANEEITGTVTIEYKDGTSKTETLQKRGYDHFVGQLERTDAFSCTVTFEVKGKKVSAVFSHQGLNIENAVTYTCSMHPEIEQNKPGTCPKCGMKLIEK